MNLQAANLLVTLLFVFYRLLKGKQTKVEWPLDLYTFIESFIIFWLAGQSSSCSALNALTQNSNSSEVSCSVQSSCFLQCTNRNNQLETVVDLFHLTVLPCAEPSPAVRIELLGQIDFAVQNGQRRTQLNETLTETDSLVQYSVIISGIVFGVYEFMVNASNSSSNIGISVSQFCVVVHVGYVCMIINNTIVITYHSACTHIVLVAVEAVA